MLSHRGESAFAGQGFLPFAETVSCARGSEVRKQCVCIGIRDRQSVHVQDRVAKSGANKSIADVVHVEKMIDVLIIINVRPGATKLEQTVWPESREDEQTVILQDSRNFPTDDRRIAYPRQQQIRKDDVDALLGKRQRASIGLNERRLVEPALVRFRASEHTGGHIDTDHAGAAKTLRQLPRCLARGAAKVDDDGRFDDDRLQSCEKTLSRVRVHEIGSVVRRRGTVEAAPDVGQSEGRSIVQSGTRRASNRLITLSRFPVDSPGNGGGSAAAGVPG